MQRWWGDGDPSDSFGRTEKLGSPLRATVWFAVVSTREVRGQRSLTIDFGDRGSVVDAGYVLPEVNW